MGVSKFVFEWWPFQNLNLKKNEKKMSKKDSQKNAKKIEFLFFHTDDS